MVKTLTVSASALCLFHFVHAQAACKVDIRPAVETGEICRKVDSSQFIDSGSDLIASLERCLLARPVRDIKMEPKPGSIQDSNCFLQGVLRPEVTEAIKRGAESYLAIPRAERTSGRPYQLDESLSDALKSARPGFSDGSEDVYGLLLVFIERTYLFIGNVPGPVSRLQERGRREGIYYQVATDRWIAFEYASFLTGSETLGAEARKTIKASNRHIAPPETYSAKGCKKKILYNWPTTSQSFEPYADLPEDVTAYGVWVHVGTCSDDQSLWVYHYRVGWKKVPSSDIPATCKQLSNYFDDPDPVALACEKYQ
jgi:hypothetical protein